MKEKTLYSIVESVAKQRPNATALHYMGVDICYSKLILGINAIAGWFTSKGIGKGDAVTLCMPNIPQAVICFYAVNKIGAVAHMVHPLAPETQLREYMKKVGSKTLCLPDIFANKYANLLSENVTVLLSSPAYYLGALKRTLFALKNARNINFTKKFNTVTRFCDAVKSKSTEKIENDSRKTAVYLHSGGTGGDPKTIKLSSYAINSLCANSLDILGIKKGEFKGGSMLAVLPMFHGFGLAMGVHAMLCNGGTIALMPKFHTADTIKLIERNEVNYLIGVPVLYEALLANKDFSGEKLKNLRQAFVGGDFVPNKLLRDFNAKMIENGSSARLFEGYGLTETVTVCAVNTFDSARDGSVGKAIGKVKIEAFSLDGKMLERGESGELCISGDQLMQGYLGDEEGTKKTFFTYDGEKWVRSGDIGIVDGDGFVFFKSRIKRIAKVNGITVFPSEIENLCMNEIESIKEAHAVAGGDGRTGDAIVMFVSTKSEISDEDKDALSQRISDLIENRLSVYARPRQIFFLTDLPKTQVGKVDGNKLKDIYL